MKKNIRAGRYTTDNSEPIVVFIIGMRINKRWAVHQWLPVFKAMPGMIKELYTIQEDRKLLRFTHPHHDPILEINRGPPCLRQDGEAFDCLERIQPKSTT